MAYASSFSSAVFPPADFDPHAFDRRQLPGEGNDPPATFSSSSSTASSSWDLPEPPSIGKALRNFRINGLFCDVALHFTSNSWGGIGNGDAPPPPLLFAHKVVLAACSPYFFSGLEMERGRILFFLDYVNYAMQLNL